MAATNEDAAAPAVSIVIPTWNSVQELLKCLRALGANTPGVSYEVIVVDNGSVDTTARVLAQLPFVKLVTNPQNLGFSRACNQGAALARAPLLLFLNDDAQPQPNWLPPLMATLRDHAQVGLASAKLVQSDTTIEQAGYSMAYASPYPLTPLPEFLAQPFAALAHTREFAAVSASCVLIRTELYRALGGFDEGFINGMEDVDLCLKAHRLGFSSVVVAESVVLHEPRMPAERTAFAKHNMERLNQRWNSHDMRWGYDFRQFASLRPNLPHRVPVSVIVVAKDALASGAACVEHVLAYAQADDEVILVEDCASPAFSHWAQVRVQSDQRLRRLPSEVNETYAQSACKGLQSGRHPVAAVLPSTLRPGPQWLHSVLGQKQDDHAGDILVFPTRLGGGGGPLGPYHPARPHRLDNAQNESQPAQPTSVACVGRRMDMIQAFTAPGLRAHPFNFLSQLQATNNQAVPLGAAVYPVMACDAIVPLAAKREMGPSLNKHLAALVRIHDQEPDLHRCLQQLHSWGLRPENVWMLYMPTPGGNRLDVGQVKSASATHFVQVADSHGLAAAMHRIVSESELPFFALLDDQMLIPAVTAETLLDHLASQPQLALVGPLLNVFKGGQASQHSVNALHTEDWAIQLAWQNRCQVRNTMQLDSHCIFGQRKAMLQLGPMDGSFSLLDYAIKDWVARARYHGFTCQIALDAYAHFVEREGLSSHAEEPARNHAQLMAKWELKRTAIGLPELQAVRPPRFDAPPVNKARLQEASP